MARAAYFDLRQVLTSKQVTLTSEEEKLFKACDSKAVGNFIDGALIGSGFMAVATQWLKYKRARLTLSGGAAAILGFWMFNRSLDSSVEQILAQDGSQMQKELLNIVMNKYRDDPRIMQLITKHFYTEKVYDDSVATQPRLRWRYRNHYSDGVSHGQGTNNSDSQGKYHSDYHSHSNNKPHNNVHSDFSDVPISQRKTMVSKQVPVHADFGLMADPLDCIFGNLTVSEIDHHNNSSMETKVQSRKHRRSHRRRRINEHKVSSDHQHA